MEIKTKIILTSDDLHAIEKTADILTALKDAGILSGLPTEKDLYILATPLNYDDKTGFDSLGQLFNASIKHNSLFLKGDK